MKVRILPENASDHPSTVFPTLSLCLPPRPTSTSILGPGPRWDISVLSYNIFLNRFLEYFLCNPQFPHLETPAWRGKKKSGVEFLSMTFCVLFLCAPTPVCIFACWSFHEVEAHTIPSCVFWVVFCPPKKANCAEWLVGSETWRERKGHGRPCMHLGKKSLVKEFTYSIGAGEHGGYSAIWRKEISLLRLLAMTRRKLIEWRVSIFGPSLRESLQHHIEDLFLS